MGAVQDAFIRDFLDAWGDGTSDPDTERILAAFSEDAEWQLWVPGGPVLRGRTAIGKDIERQLRFCSQMRCGLLSITSSETQVMTERHDTFVAGDVLVDHYLMAVYDLDADGKITRWREYFDIQDVDRQLTLAKATVPKVGS